MVATEIRALLLRMRIHIADATAQTRPAHLDQTADTLLLACGRTERTLTDLATETGQTTDTALDGALDLQAHGLITLSADARLIGTTPAGDRLRHERITAITAVLAAPYDVPPALPPDPRSPLQEIDRALHAIDRLHTPTENPPETP
ncbi:hypothetical protein AHOG_05195 [Actinoalloteichus hoggarensis]|uniref:MarR family protein n=2 Tax=Actinoalloteichus hoggarensis TaxID=1470176 RepID=A0A221VYR9_9PSEU|nr:hypothetical protein AHOG_05195 [Actinoalloteichus hoggarensis]